MNTSYDCLKSQVLYREEYSLVPIRDEDKYEIMNWRNAQMEVLRQNRLLTPEDQEQYFSKVVSQLFTVTNPPQLLFSFLLNGNLIGYGGLVYINWQDKRAEVSFLLDDKRAADKKLYKKEFSVYLGLIKQLAFIELDFNRIYTETFDIRDFHIGILEANGFLLEGKMKEHVLINGVYRDSLIHGYLKKYFNAEK